MTHDLFKKLKSGTDIRGVAVDGVENEPLDFTDEIVTAIGFGYADWLYENVKTDEPKITVAVGRDSRISGERLFTLFTDSLIKSGISIKNLGISSTPAMFMACIDNVCDVSVEITASHHPFNKNGFKFFTKLGGLEGSDIENILEKAAACSENGHSVSDIQGSIEEYQYMSTYAEHLRDMICEQVNADDYARPLRDFKIVVDAGNGVGGFYATKVLEPLGADITGSQFLEPDGMFPNHIPNPENMVAMSYLETAVLRNKADLGIIFDTDVDRAACVLDDGEEVNRDALIALASCVALEGNEGGTIVTDSVTSDHLRDFIENHLGGKQLRFKRGYKNVINEAKRLNLEACINAPLAIETSGHAAMRENYFLDDGAYLMTKIIIKGAILRKENKKLESLIEELQKPVEQYEARIKILDEDFKTYGNTVIDGLEKFIENDSRLFPAHDNFEGVRANCEEAKGWFLLRMSVHDPILPLNIESDIKGGVAMMKKIVAGFLENYNRLDLGVLTDEQ